MSQLPPKAEFSYFTEQQTQQFFAANPQLFGSSPAAQEIGPIAVIIFGTTKPLQELKTPLQIRTIFAILRGCYDTLAAYDPLLLGSLTGSSLRRPTVEHTLQNQQVAAVYSTFKILKAVLPRAESFYIERVFNVLQLDPTVTSLDPATPAGIGNIVGTKVVEFLYTDGTNQLGDIDRTFNRKNYSDYTGYAPKNTAYELKCPANWQPDSIPTPPGDGYFSVQEHVLPMLGKAKLIALEKPDQFPVCPPEITLDFNCPGYRKQADDVIAASAGLNDATKMEAEFFDDKFLGFGTPVLFKAAELGWGYKQFVMFDFALNMAAYDGMVASWFYKRVYDSVRPFSSIRTLYKDKTIQAWGGPGKGTVTMLGQEWESYLDTGAWSEYPSATSAVSGAAASLAETLLKDDTCGFSVNFPSGISRFEPGLTPQVTTTVGPFPTWKAFGEASGYSRVTGGVHFEAAVRAGLDLGYEVGPVTVAKALALFNGSPF